MAAELIVPPHNIDAEQSVIGGVLVSNHGFDEVADKLTSDDFYRREHRMLWLAMCELARANSPVDIVTLSEALKEPGDLDAVGGLGYIGSLAANTPSAANIVAYARIVKDKSIERQLIQAAQEIIQQVHEDKDTRAKLDHAQALLMRISDRRDTEGPTLAREVLGPVIDEIERHYKAGGTVTGLPTGFLDLDHQTSGLHAEDLIIIAGRPSMGKTSLAMNIAEYVATDKEMPALVFSMEMSNTQLVMRSLSTRSQVPFQRLRTGRMRDDDWPRLTAAVGSVNRSKLLIDDSPALSVLDIRARSRRVQRKHGLSLIVVDYIQLMRGDGQNRNDEVSGISRGLKSLAKELKVPVIALSQLNRGVENRTNKRPVMADLRDSGSIEQDADLILFIYRDEVYDPESPARGIAEVIIGKQRNGPIDTVRLAWLGEYCRFENYIGGGADVPPPNPARGVSAWHDGFDG